MLAGLLIVVLTLASTAAGAIEWRYASQGSCSSGVPRGSSWLNWSGASSSAWGESKGWLWYRTSATTNTWAQGSVAYHKAQGSTNNATARNEYGYVRGTWNENGWHNSNFDVSNVRSSGANFTC